MLRPSADGNNYIRALSDSWEDLQLGFAHPPKDPDGAGRASDGDHAVSANSPVIIEIRDLQLRTPITFARQHLCEHWGRRPSAHASVGQRSEHLHLLTAYKRTKEKKSIIPTNSLTASSFRAFM